MKYDMAANSFFDGLSEAPLYAVKEEVSVFDAKITARNRCILAFIFCAFALVCPSLK